MNGKKNDPDYAPAPNVIKGIVPKGGGSCIGSSEEESSDTVGLPRDDCFETGTCSRFGDGVWTNGRANYVATNYAGTDPSLDAAAATTRYEYYLAEIAAAGGGGQFSRCARVLSQRRTGQHQAVDTGVPRRCRLDGNDGRRDRVQGGNGRCRG